LFKAEVGLTVHARSLIHVGRAPAKAETAAHLLVKPRKEAFKVRAKRAGNREAHQETIRRKNNESKSTCKRGKKREETGKGMGDPHNSGAKNDS